VTNIPSDNVAIALGLAVAFAWPLTILAAAFLAWVIYTLFTMASPVWVVLYVMFRLFLYITVWVFIFSGVLWLCGWSGPILFFADIYAALPRGLYNWMVK
jgi:hypothetical protein